MKDGFAMKKIFGFNKSSATIAFWVVLLSVLLLPCSGIGDSRIAFGFPFGFISINTEMPPMSAGDILLMNSLTDPLTFVIDVWLVMVLVNFIKMTIHWLEHRNDPPTIQNP